MAERQQELKLHYSQDWRRIKQINIHTIQFPGGEISGFLVVTPLPAALPLFASGLAGLGLLGWRRKRKALAA